jgi:paraquat-inducible protein A
MAKRINLDGLIACPECDFLMAKIATEKNHNASCPRCHYVLYRYRKHATDKSLALVLTALLLFVPANFLPIMKLNMLGKQSYDTVWSAVVGLYNADMRAVAGLVLLCSLIIPLLKLVCQLWVLVSLKGYSGQPLACTLLRWYQHLREWGMWEIYLLGIFVSMVKIGDVAELHLGIGLFCFIALLIVQVGLEATMSLQQFWHDLEAASTDASH